MTLNKYLTKLQGEEVDYRGVLHRDGSVLMSVSLDQLKVILSLVCFLYTIYFLQFIEFLVCNFFSCSISFLCGMYDVAHIMAPTQAHFSTQ